MMKLRRYLKNLARSGLSLLTATILLSSCSSSTSPTFLKQDIEKAVQDICKNEYKIDLKVKLIGQTLWIYMPVEDILIKADKPEKFTERFAVEENQAEFVDGNLKLQYSVKVVPEKEEIQQVKYNKDVLEKVNNVWKALRRVLFSMDRKKGSEPLFCCLITADIKNGFETKEIFYYQDMKKVSYDFISWTEYQHRAIDETNISSDIIGDKEGNHLEYKDVTMEEFLTLQIQHRVKLKFQKPEVEKNADTDKEVLKIAVLTLKIYDFRDFNELDIYNAVTQHRVILNRAAVWSRPVE
jgi:hypothetical protein